MPFLDLSPNPARTPDPTEQPGNASGDQATTAAPPPPSPSGPQPLRSEVQPLRIPRVQAATSVKVRTGRYGDLEEHELIHLLDTLDDERSRARFRESVYISFIVYLAIAWFLFYGPHILFHQPYYKDPIAAMKEHDKELTFIAPKAPILRPQPRPVLDNKTMKQLQQQVRQAAPTPQPPAPTPPAPQEEARIPTPPVAQPALPLPPAPRPSISSLPSAPQPNLAENSQSPSQAMRSARGPSDISPPSTAGPLQAGAQVLSDTQGVDFSAYLTRVKRDLYRNWMPLIPEEAAPPLSKRGITRIRFTILPDGSIAAMTLESGSGDVAIDKAAWGAIISEGQFPPLPRQFHGPLLELRYYFYLNEPEQ